MRPIIKAEQISKQYRIGTGAAARYSTLRETLMTALRLPFRNGRRRGSGEGSTIWALKDVSFEVQPGEVIGIIGRNGAGKSTLLKILSRITEPTAGRAELYGRVGSLLEVGTGFHPELTGRENIFLNGSILGMTRKEIGRKFDEIVAFAEVGRFTDTPVKRYSSGMYLRLAFAVAAHLEPEILVIDEVLAVGDAAFQKKCIGKMSDVARQGRTVLFVSHNMTAVRSLCARAILLEQGCKAMEGEAGACIDHYLAEITKEASNEVELTKAPRPGVADTTLKIERVRIGSADGRPLVRSGDPLEVELEFRVSDAIEGVTLGINVQSVDSVSIMECRSSHYYGAIERFSPGRYRISCRIKQNILSPGLYFLGVGGRCASKYLDYVPHALAFEVYSDETVSSLWLDDVRSCVRVPSEWDWPQPISDNAKNA
jgi:lipopolysaccharide transport system ATP-binding protein